MEMSMDQLLASLAMSPVAAKVLSRLSDYDYNYSFTTSSHIESNSSPPMCLDALQFKKPKAKPLTISSSSHVHTEGSHFPTAPSSSSLQFKVMRGEPLTVNMNIHTNGRKSLPNLSTFSAHIVAFQGAEANRQRQFPNAAAANLGCNKSDGGASLRIDDVNAVERLLVKDSSTGLKYQMNKFISVGDNGSGHGGGCDDNDGHGGDHGHDHEYGHTNNNNNIGESEEDDRNGGGAHSRNDGWGNTAYGRLKCLWTPISMVAAGILLGYFLGGPRKNVTKNTTNEHRHGASPEILSRNKLAFSFISLNGSANN